MQGKIIKKDDFFGEEPEYRRYSVKHHLRIVPFAGFPPSKYITFKCVNKGCQYLLQFERASLAEIMAGADTLVYVDPSCGRPCPDWVGHEFRDEEFFSVINE